MVVNQILKCNSKIVNLDKKNHRNGQFMISKVFIIKHCCAAQGQ